MSPPQRREFTVMELGESHYRPTELPWTDAGSPSATVAIGVDDGRLVVLADIRAGEAHFAPADATNPFDNEHPDTMAAGIQLYLSARQGTGAWMLVPEHHGERVRVRAIASPGMLAAPSARWRQNDRGYEIRTELLLPEDEPDFDVIINETTAARQRRRGQLVLSGAHGEFAYLRGDRHDPRRFLRLVVRR